MNGQHAVPLFPPVRVGPPLPGKVKNEETGSMPFYIFSLQGREGAPHARQQPPLQGQQLTGMGNEVGLDPTPPPHAQCTFRIHCREWDVGSSPIL